MGHDLDSLLDATGIGAMAGRQYEKAAAAAAHQSEPFDLHKLASECRDAASSTATHRASQGRALVEKTAAVVVISRTIDEINQIVGDPVEKLASSDAAIDFIGNALDRGHSPEAIASFLKNAGVADLVRRVAKGGRAAFRAGRGERLVNKGKRSLDLAKREYSDALRTAERTGDLNKQNQLVERLRRKFGDEEAGKLIRSSGARLRVPAARDVMKATEGPSATATIGGKKMELSRGGAQKLKRYGIPAAAAGGGMAIAGGKNDDSKGSKSGLTVIRG